MVFHYPLVSANMAGWKILELNGLARKITDFYGPLSIAMFEYQRVVSSPGQLTTLWDNIIIYCM